MDSISNGPSFVLSCTGIDESGAFSFIALSQDQPFSTFYRFVDISFGRSADFPRLGEDLVRLRHIGEPFREPNLHSGSENNTH